MIEILVPTYGRANSLWRVYRNIEATTLLAHNTWFIIEDTDTDSYDAVVDLGLRPLINRNKPNYSGAINTGYQTTDGQYLFCASDDLEFTNGWAPEAIEKFDGWVGVVGTMDGVNPYVNAGFHATHYMVERRYLNEYGGVVDQGPYSFLYEGYGHNYCDTEFIGTAKARAKFRPCFTSVVRHKHWSVQGGIPADSTTDKENATYGQDSVLYDSRRELWQSISR
jgi:glycosyltransferase involved in cell wall biosynthesis